MAKKKTTAIRIDPELVEWFDKNFPIFGAKQWFIEPCFRELKEMHDEGKFEPPVDLLTIVVREVVGDL